MNRKSFSHVLAFFCLAILFIIPGCNSIIEPTKNPHADTLVDIPVHSNLLNFHSEGDEPSDMLEPAWYTDINHNLHIIPLDGHSSETQPTVATLYSSEKPPGYDFTLYNRLFYESGNGAIGYIRQEIPAQLGHTYRMTAIVQNAGIESDFLEVRFISTYDYTIYARKSVDLSQGPQRISFDFTFSDTNHPNPSNSSFILSFELYSTKSLNVNIGYIKVWDATPPKVTLPGQPYDQGCAVFPTNNVWNVPVDDWLVDTEKTRIFHNPESIGLSSENWANSDDKRFNRLKFEFAAFPYYGAMVGMPINIVDQYQSSTNIDLLTRFMDIIPAYPWDQFKALYSASGQMDLVVVDQRTANDTYPGESDDAGPFYEKRDVLGQGSYDPEVLFPIPENLKVQGFPADMGYLNWEGTTFDGTPSSDPSYSDINADWYSNMVKVTPGKPCELYELYKTSRRSDGTWQANAAAYWSLGTNTVGGYWNDEGQFKIGRRGKNYWTSADAAGLPVFPGIVKADEVEQGEIHHALRISIPQTCSNTSSVDFDSISPYNQAFVWPARHAATTQAMETTNCIPLGTRIRLDPQFINNRPPSCTPLSQPSLIILQALQKYGAIVADNGSGSMTLNGEPSSIWANPIEEYDDVFLEALNSPTTQNCWPSNEDFEVLQSDRYAHWLYQDGVSSSMAVYGENE